MLVTLEIAEDAADARVLKVVTAAQRQRQEATVADAKQAMRELRRLVDTVRDGVGAGNGLEVGAALGAMADALSEFDRELQLLFASL